MELRVQKIEGGLCVMVPPEVAEALHLSEGASVELRPKANESAVRFLTVEEAVSSYLKTEAQHSDAYRELAK